MMNRQKVTFLDSGLSLDKVSSTFFTIGSVQSFVDEDPLCDSVGHGTDMCMVLAQMLISSKNLNSFDFNVGQFICSDGHGTLTSLTAALSWASEIDSSIVIIPSGFVAYSPKVHQAVKALTRRGSVILAAAGNLRAGQRQPLYPAAFPEVIAVGCTKHVEAYKLWHPQPNLLLSGIISLEQYQPPRRISGTSCATMQAVLKLLE